MNDTNITSLPWVMSDRAPGNIVSSNGRLTANCMGYSHSGKPETPIENLANANFILHCVNTYNDREALYNAVIILPDDAEVYIVKEGMRFYYTFDKIIQRNGKPCIYESALKAAKGAGG